MITITRDLPLVSFDGNAMRLTVQSNNTLDSGYEPRPFYTIFLKVRTEIEYASESFIEEEIVESEQPDASGIVTFDLSRIIRGYVKPSFPFPPTEGQIITKDYAVSKFYFSLADGYGIPFAQQNYQAEEGPYYSIPGGLQDWLLEQLEADGDDSYTYLLESKIFLTNQPSFKAVATNQPELLRFFNIGTDPVNVSLILKEYDLDGNEYTSIVVANSTLEKLCLYNINVTPGFAFSLRSNTDIWEVWLESDGNIISEVAQYRRDARHEPRSKFFVFQNSLGGFDSVAATGRLTEQIEGESQVNFLPNITTLRNAFTINQDRIMCKNIFKGIIGLFSADSLAWLQEFFRSENRKYVNDTRLENIGLKVSAYQISPDVKVPAEIEIECYIGTPDKHYSKKRVVKASISLLTRIKYGYLYNLYAVTNAKNLAASGWTVPTLNDLIALITALGTNSGAKAREIGLTYWNLANGTNTAKLNMRGAGIRDGADNAFKYLKDQSRFATSEYTSDDDTQSIIWPMVTIGKDYDLETDEESWTIYNGNYGHSVRLRKTTTTLQNGEQGTYTGNDGKKYRTICIGGVEWLADNLAETKYRDGTLIPEITDNTEWREDLEGARCAYNNDTSNV